ncbi:hypothetical protein [Algivirga pacifica]|uniref:Uncharacterized protein n=1 Tax=Algivirga pacifica TaxID=1162670 RepID=A0ABP9DN64_9BACT
MTKLIYVIDILSAPKRLQAYAWHVTSVLLIAYILGGFTDQPLPESLKVTVVLYASWAILKALYTFLKIKSDEVSVYVKQLSEAKKYTQTLQDALREANKMIETHANRLREESEKTATVQTQLVQVNNRCVTLQNALKEAQEASNLLEDAKRSLEGRMSDAEATATAHISAKETLQRKYDELVMHHDDLLSKLNGEERTRQLLEEAIHHLKECYEQNTKALDTAKKRLSACKQTNGDLPIRRIPEGLLI